MQLLLCNHARLNFMKKLLNYNYLLKKKDYYFFNCFNY